MVVLYESDITDLVSILQDTEENLTVEFERGDTIYETLDELRGHQGEVLHDFKLTQSRPTMKLAGRVPLCLSRAITWGCPAMVQLKSFRFGKR